MIQQGASEGTRCRSGCPSSICSVKCAFIPQMPCKWIEALLALPLSGAPTLPPSPPSRLPPWWTSTSPHSQHTFVGSACVWESVLRGFCACGSCLRPDIPCSYRYCVLWWVTWPHHPSGFTLDSSVSAHLLTMALCLFCRAFFMGHWGGLFHICCPLTVHETIVCVVICCLRCLLDTNVCSLMLFTGTLVHQRYRSELGSPRVCSSETIDPYRSQ